MKASEILEKMPDCFLNNNRHFRYDETESPIERDFLYKLAEVADQNVLIRPQQKCQCVSGKRYRLDVFCEAKDGRKVAFECDGAEFHNGNDDSMRDRDIISSGHADCIYRLRGSDIWRARDELFDVLMNLEPSFFRFAREFKHWHSFSVRRLSGPRFTHVAELVFRREFIEGNEGDPLLNRPIVVYFTKRT